MSQSRSIHILLEYRLHRIKKKKLWTPLIIWTFDKIGLYCRLYHSIDDVHCVWNQVMNSLLQQCFSLHWPTMFCS